MTRRIEDWKSRLIDLSRRNNLLYFKPSKRGNLSVSSPSMESIFNRLVLRKRHLEFWYPPEEPEVPKRQSQNNTNFSFLTEKASPTAKQLVCEGTSRTDLEKVLKNLHRRSLLDYRERGVRILHAAFGMLVWKEKETDEEVRSPLILVPIELARKSFREPFSISVPPIEEEVVLNPALQVKLKKDFKIELPHLPEYWESQSLLNYFSVVTQVANELGWRVESTVEIGLFSFHKLVIYNDLDANAGVITQHPIIRTIAGIKDEQLETVSLPEEKDVDNIQAPEKTFQVLDADSSQRVSIEYALRGQSFVMQGPPGTGKSQTIANIIAECIAQGKSVLFVSDKMAALEVVYKRLREVGLSSFCLELHSSKANKREVVAELKRCLDEHLVPRKMPSAHDFEKMTLLRDSLNNYVVSLHQKRFNLQKSAYDILGELSSLECVPFVAVELSNLGSLTPQRMLELEDLMSRLKSVWQVMEDPDFAWRGYRGNEYNVEVRAEVSTVLGDLISAIEALKTEAGKFANQLGLSTPSTFERVNWLIAIGNLLLESPKPEASWVMHPNLDKLISEAEVYLAMFEWCKATRTRLLERYSTALFSLALTTSAELEAALSAIDKLLLHSGLEESELLEKREKLLDFARHTQVLYAKWSEKSWQLAQMLGLPTGNLTPDRVRQLSRIALLCFSEDKPEPRWLDPDHFQRVKEEFPQIKKDYQEYKALKLKLEKTYTREFFKTDLDELITRYNDMYKSSLRWFRSSFYRDQKQITLLTHDGKVPKSVLQDLLDARKLKMLSAELEASAESVKGLLGHFYEGYATDFERVENAIETTSELFRQAGAAGIPEELAKLVYYGSDPPLVIRQLGNELEESFEKWDRLAKDLSSLLPTSRLPTSSLPLYETPIAMLQDWATSVEKQLVVLCEITRETLKTSKGEAPQNYKQLIDDLKDAEQVRKKEAAVLGEHESLQAKFGFRFADLETCWEEILSVLHWTRKLRTLFGPQRVPETFADVVSRGAESAPSNSDLISRYDATVKSLATLEARFETELTYRGQKLQALSLEAMQSRVKWLRERVDDLQVWVDFKETKHAFSLVGLSAFFDRLAENPPPASQLLDIFRKAAYQEWLNQLYEEDQNLGQFRREKHEHVIAEFIKLDQELIRLSPNRVIEAANSRKPQDILIQANDSEVTTLLKEALKKRRLMPIRDLLQRIPHLLSRLKPCLLMSPMSVSQFLPPELMKFDLILFDEASQIVPEDAIGTIYRGKTIVVAGDNKQLPPTSFFQKSLLEDIDWDEVTDEDVEVFDSVLDECAGVGLPVKTLRWHYRSKHEELIAFSNSHFYDGTLITFPSAIAKDDGLGVKLVHVPDGVYDRGGRRDNLREAEVVADLVFEHFQKYPKKTLGVVTFSIAQMDAVDEAVERRRRQQPEYEHFFKEDRLEGFFVKNLENVQGDERDVIILSLGYGYDPQGQMTMNFGPVNRAGGERRLNVAVTRAREMTILVSSVKAADMDMESAKSAGTVILHAYLEYAEKGPEVLKSATREAVAFESPIEEDVAMVLQRLGYAFVPHVGCSGCPIDMGVVDPNNSGGYLLGVEFDGATYQNSSSARDRDRLRAQVLKQLGWRIHRVWSPTWVSRRDSEIRRLSHALEEAHKFHLGKEAPSTDVDLEEDDAGDLPQEVDVQKIQFAGIEKIGVPYKVHALKAEYAPSVRVPSAQRGWAVQPNEFHFQENCQLQARLLEELIQNEGPIHFDYAVKRLVSAWGLKRKNPKIVHAVREALNLLIVKEKVIVKGNFLWPPELQEVQARAPVSGVPESKRKPEHIPPEEIENAMKAIAQYALGISAESLIAETAKVFGFNHTGEKSRKRFSDIYKRLLWEKKLICDNDLVTVA
ncbi:DUF3320 domain-containing protein [Candidatus Bathyarchaeota archaeon]|nr:DUF3320 domain-containing protein [Candidatus Bathyarchaeota archaeon]